MDIYDLFKYGKLRSLKIGCNSKVAKDFFNNYPNIMKFEEHHFNDVCVLANEQFEVHYFDDSVINIILKAPGPNREPKLFLKSRLFLFNNKITIQKIAMFFSELSIDWHVYQKYCKDRQIEIITEGYASVEFVEYHGKFLIGRVHLVDKENL